MKREEEIFANLSEDAQITRYEERDDRYRWREESRCVRAILIEFTKNNIEWDTVMIPGYHLNSFISKYGKHS